MRGEHFNDGRAQEVVDSSALIPEVELKEAAKQFLSSAVPR
jgi:hypothetical protein